MFIYKYRIGRLVPNLTSVTMPRGHKVLSVGIQDSQISVWALVDMATDKSVTRFETHWSGRELEELGVGESRQFIGTVTENGIVCHVFEIVSPNTNT